MPDPLPYDQNTREPDAATDAHACSSDWSVLTGVLTLYLRDGNGGESDIGNGRWAIALKGLKTQQQNEIAHEIGHCFGLCHAFNESFAGPLTLKVAAQQVESFVTNWLSLNGWTIDTGCENWNVAYLVGQDFLQTLFDGDLGKYRSLVNAVSDTPPTIQEWEQSGAPDSDPYVGRQPVTVNVSTNLIHAGQPQTFSVALDVTNTMSYFLENPNCTWISPQHAAIIHNTILYGPPITYWARHCSGQDGSSSVAMPFARPESLGLTDRSTFLRRRDKGFSMLRLAPPPLRSPGVDQSSGNIYWTAHGTEQQFPPLSEIPGNGMAQGSPCTATFQNRLYVSVLGPTGHFFFTSTAAGNSPATQWSGQWDEFTGGGLGIAAPAITCWGNAMYAFVPGDDHQVYFNWSQDGVNFRSSWAPLPDAPGVPPFQTKVGVAAAYINGYMVMVAVRQSDGALFYNAAPYPGKWSGWVQIPGGGQTDASAGSGGFVRSEWSLEDRGERVRRFDCLADHRHGFLSLG